MHSILESDGVSSDPFEVLCYMGTLIVEGRTPKEPPAGDTVASSEAVTKSAKPYTEGPHCPNFMKLYNKDVHSVHKCTENNIICIRHNNLKQHLQSLQHKSPSIIIEVSLGPDCLCGELRSQSTLVSCQPSKRDIVLEQWTITIGHKQLQEPSSQMSVMNLYQAVRSLLHFSQLTAWYMSNNGLRPSNVIYRVGLPEDSTFISDDNFVSHDFPMADINKTVWMKISVRTLPRMEKIPTVFCPQHSSSSVETAQTSQEPPKKEPLHGRFAGETRGELLEPVLPLKFQGVRKKTFEAQERKRKKHITLYNSPSPLGIEKCSGIEFLDGIKLAVEKMSPQEGGDYFSSKRMFQGESLKGYQGESSKAEYKKSKSSAFPADFSELVKPQTNFDTFDTFSCNYFEQKSGDPTVDLLMMSLNNFSDSKCNSDYRTKGKLMKSSCEASALSPERKKSDTNAVMDILDDRMQISCAISGKHHCKWECEEESDLNNPGGNVEKPKRRRSLSKARMNEGAEDGRLDSEKILHGKFKEIDSYKPDLCLPLREQEADEAFASSSGCCQRPLESPPKPKTNVDNSNNSGGNPNKSQTPKIESLPLKETPAVDEIPEVEETAREAVVGESSPKEPSQRSTWVRTESFESFRRGCVFARDAAVDDESESEDELSDDTPETSNPFLAAILRTTKKSRTNKKCDNSVKNKLGDRAGKSESCLKKLTGSSKGQMGKERMETKVDGQEKVQSEHSGGSPRKKSSGVRLVYDSPSEFLSKNLGRFKSLFDTQDLKKEASTCEGPEDFYEDIGSNSSSTKTIPVPSAHDKLKFRRSLDSAAQLVFHRCSGLPLTSSPAPVRRNNTSFSFDSSLNSVSAIKSALFEPSNSLSSEDENESEGSLKSPASPGAWSVSSKPINYHSLSPLPLLGSFEESVLNGRLEPVSTVQGFTAELGASGSFCPRHLHLPVTVFFYTLGDNDKVSAPYLGHINLGKKGYSVPRSGTIQVTLFNPLRTVVKMFVVVYDLHDMPGNSHTFLRQRTLYVPTSQKESTVTDKKETPFDQEDYHKYLRYLIHLRFVSGKSGRIYLHTDIRMVIFRKADEDTATALDDGETYELRSHTHGPSNPKFSPRK